MGVAKREQKGCVCAAAGVVAEDDTDVPLKKAEPAKVVLDCNAREACKRTANHQSEAAMLAMCTPAMRMRGASDSRRDGGRKG